MSEQQQEFEADPYVALHPQTRPFWAAASEGRLLVPRCRDCGRAHWYPRPFCPLCNSDNVEWTEASGKGEVFSFSVMRKAETPYVLAFVRLDEGPALMTHIVDTPPEAVTIGQAVRVRFRKTETGRSVPVFAPA